ncbi:MAG: ABC transporter permease [Planctomycetota bacterium]
MTLPTNHQSSTSFVERRTVRIAIPVVIGLAVIATWEAVVRIKGIEPYLLPSPSRIAQALVEDRSLLLAALWVTLKTTMLALSMAVVGGVGLAVLFSLSRILEISLFPYAIVLQVTPLIAIAPLINVWLYDQVWLVLLICAWIVAFFPILSNTVVGLKSVDENHRDLFRLYGASAWQRLRFLMGPTALPYFFAGLKIAGNLALVGAIVAEFAVGAAGEQTGLASTILESGFRLEIPRMFAALSLISATGICIYFVMHGFSQWILGPWHSSAGKGDQ